MESQMNARLAEILKKVTVPNMMINEQLPNNFLLVITPLRQAIIFLMNNNPIIIQPASKSSSFIDIKFVTPNS